MQCKAPIRWSKDTTVVDVVVTVLPEKLKKIMSVFEAQK